jgi:hypothetical protein
LSRVVLGLARFHHQRSCILSKAICIKMHCPQIGMADALVRSRGGIVDGRHTISQHHHNQARFAQ